VADQVERMGAISEVFAETLQRRLEGVGFVGAVAIVPFQNGSFLGQFFQQGPVKAPEGGTEVEPEGIGG